MHVGGGELAENTAQILITFLRDAVAGGVLLQLHYLTDTVANSFTFADAADHPVTDANEGWGDVASPGTGGFWASVIE